MSDRAQRVLSELLKYDTNNGCGFPMLAICEFVKGKNNTPICEEYELLTIKEERQVIKAFLEFAY